MKKFKKENIRNAALYIKIIFSIIIYGILFSQSTLAGESNGNLETKLNKLIQNGSCIVSKNNNRIISYNPDNPYIPASIWKIVTALAALETLGEDYRFKTEFYLDSSSDLYVKGYGDPFLISEEIDSIFKALSKRGVAEINNIYLDNSAFKGPEAPPGISSSLNPYDVTNSALAVNFNTINFYVDKNGEISSAENQTPTLAIMKKLGRGFKEGTHRINISKSPENVLRHTGELFRAFQHLHGIPGSGMETKSETPPDLKPFYVHHSSRLLKDIIKAMMLYSNNYTANQIYLTLGASEHGHPATWEKSEKSLRSYIDKNFPVYSESITFDEGSGISRNNRITARAMVDMLDKFKPFAGLLPIENDTFIKSGTLKGVYSYAGYFVREGKCDSFVIILNQERNYRDRILKLLEQQYNTTP